MRITLNQLIREFKILSDAHGSINSFFFGSFYDAITRDAVQYPLLVATLQPSSMSAKKTSVTIAFTLADKYTLSDFEQMNEVHSDLMQIVSDIRAVMRSPRWVEYIDVNETITYAPFQHKGADVTAGHIATLVFEVDDYEDFCSAPIFGYDFNADISGEVPNPATCDDATWTLENTQGTEIDDGSIASGGSDVIVAPDSSLNVNSSPVLTIPSGGTSNLMVEQDGVPVGSFDSGSNSWVVPSCSQELFLYLKYNDGDDTISIDIGSNQVGTITTVDSTGLTNVVIEVNGTPQSLPFTLVNGDSVEVTFDSASSNGVIELIGTY